MAQKDELQQLIAHLGERKCKLISAGLVGDKLRLFASYTLKKKLSEVEVRANFSQLSDLAYASLRTRLMDAVITMLAEQQRKTRPAARVALQVQAAELAMDAGRFQLAIRTLCNAMTQAIAIDDFHSLALMGAVRRRLGVLLEYDRQADTKWHAIDLLLQQLAALQQRYDLALQYMHAALEIKNGGLEGRRNKIQQLGAQIPQHDANDRTRAGLMLARAHWICLALQGDIPRCESALDWAIHLGQTTPSVWYDIDAIDCLEAAYITKAAIMARDMAFEPAIAMLQQFERACIKQDRFILGDVRDISIQLSVRKLLQSEKKSVVLKGLMAIKNQVGQPENIGIHMYTTFLWILQYFFENEDLENAKPWLALIAKSNHNIKRTSLLVNGFIIELALHFQAGEMDSVENAARRLSYLAKSRNSDLQFVRIVSNGFRSIAKSGSPTSKALKRFLDQISSLAGTIDYQGYFEILDLRQFLQNLVNSKQH